MKKKQERCVTDLPSISLDSMQPKNHDLDARHKVMKMLQLFTSVRWKHALHQAINIIKKDPIYTKPGPAIDRISGVEVGDKFNFRAELSIVGLHHPYEAGIDWFKVNGVPIVVSIWEAKWSVPWFDLSWVIDLP
jgi:[histone H3]-lysine9 N-trimethyltransferase EHMT